MNFYRLISTLAAIVLPLGALMAQTQAPPTPQDQEKQLQEFIDKEVQRLSSQLKLEYWQEFYVDSTLTHDLHARKEELELLRDTKVENSDLYLLVSDRWMEKIDSAYMRFFTEEQWSKYMKNGGAKAKRERDKRKEKERKASAGLKK